MSDKVDEPAKVPDVTSKEKPNTEEVVDEKTDEVQEITSKVKDLKVDDDVKEE